MPNNTSLYSSLHKCVLRHMSRTDRSAKRSLCDALVTLRQLADAHGISYSDLAMEASEKWAKVAGAR
jgi:hypothetical protein